MLISLLITLIIVLLVFGVLWYALTLIPLPPPFHWVVQVVLLLILALILLYMLLPLAGVRHLP